MYPNLYYVFKDWFGVEWKWMNMLNTFGIMVALSFVAAAITLYHELKRKEKLNLLHSREEMITFGKPASVLELLVNGIIGFLFGYKLLGFIFNRTDEVPAQDYIFSKEGNILGGLLLASILVFVKWYEKNKQKLKEPENRMVRIWPHDRVGDITIIALLGGLLGAKLFDAFENWSSFTARFEREGIKALLNGSGLTFYGGLIVAAVAVCWYAYKKRINLKHLVDAAAPGLILAYAIGRIGCQVAGDGDWGIYNSAYISDSTGKVMPAKPGEFQQVLKKYETYFKEGISTAEGNRNGRAYGSLDKVPHKAVTAPSFLPTWAVAYSYPQNVNDDGIAIPGITDEHRYVLPAPVFPTPFYETIIGLIIFALLWGIRKKIKIAGMLFAIYLVLNGIERYFMETIRVNDILGFQLSQAQFIAIGLIIGGLVFGFICYKSRSRTGL